MNPDQIKRKIIFTAPPQRPGAVLTNSPEQTEVKLHENKDAVSDLRSYTYDAASITQERHLNSKDHTINTNRNFVEESNTIPMHEQGFDLGPSVNASSINVPKVEPELAPIANPKIRSFAYDIKSTVDDNHVSVAQMVLAENRKREDEGTTEEDLAIKDANKGILRNLLIALGLIAIVGGIGALVFTFIRTQPIVIPPILNSEEIIRSDKKSPIVVGDSTKLTLIQKIEASRGQTIPIGTFLDLEPRSTVGGSEKVMTSSEFLAILGARLPEELSRAISDEWSFGIYSGENNYLYIVLHADNFDNAYAGMIDWEKNLKSDLGPIFSVENVAPNFIDKIYWNQDTRTILGSDNKPVFLWSIVNRNTIVITSNDNVLQKILDRLTLSNIVR